MILLNSLILLCFATTITCWALPQRWQLLPISLATGIFLGYFSPISLVILLFTALSSFYLIRFVPKLVASTLLIVFQAAAIFLYFKLGDVWSAESSVNRGSLIPLGLSYYSFRQIHYAIESYKGKLPQHLLKDYLYYLFFLPTILIGPINRFQQFYKDALRRRWDFQLFSYGLERILYGYSKIIILGNFILTEKLGKFIDQLDEKHLWLEHYLSSLRFTLNAYFQFAGYSDIAIGLALLMGFRVIENFNYPFLAPNIAEFWNRWHISLSTWCRDYVYYPILGFSRRSLIAILVSMLVLGLWHEISWNYILWATMHALGIFCWHRYNRSSLARGLRTVIPKTKLLGIFINFHFVMLSFVLLMERDLELVLQFYKTIFFLDV